MDIYEPSDHDPNFRVTSAQDIIAKCAARLGLSILWSIKYLPTSTQNAILNLLSVDSLWALVIVFAGWVLATVIGGPIGVAVNALLLVYGLYSMYEQLAVTWHSFRKWATAAYHASNDAELEVAAKHFADAISLGGITLIEIALTHRVFRATENALRKRFTTPDWLRSEFEKANELKKRTEAEEIRKKTEGKDKLTTLAEVARGEGLKRIPKDLPVGVLAGTVVAAVAVVAVTAVAVTASRSKP